MPHSGVTLVRRAWPVLLPELRHFPEQDRFPALEKARQTEFDVFELAGLALAVVAVTALTQYGLTDPSAPTRTAAALSNYASALIAIAVCVCPFHLRRLRRGLRRELNLREQHE
jgi:hypothetical protein